VISESRNDELRYKLALLRMPGIGPINFFKWQKKYPKLQELFESSQHKQKIIEKLDPKALQYLSNPDWKGVEKDLLWAEQKDCHIIDLQDSFYPKLLKEITNPPPLLFVRGQLKSLLTPQIAMVGSRHPSPNGYETAKSFADFFVQMGLTITSGLALGIDKASHEAAVQQGRSTIAVLGNSLETIYPKQHIKLARDILQEGALVSEFPIGTPPIAQNFPRRNRIISGLSLGVVVVEAALKSGSLITAQYAVEQNRDVFAIPGSIHNALSKGCHALIRQGAILVQEGKDVVEELALLIKNDHLHNVSKENEQSTSLSKTQQTLLNVIDFDMTPIDVIVERIHCEYQQITMDLLELELNGLIASIPGGYARVIRAKACVG